MGIEEDQEPGRIYRQSLVGHLSEKQMRVSRSVSRACSAYFKLNRIREIQEIPEDDEEEGSFYGLN